MARKTEDILDDLAVCFAEELKSILGVEKEKAMNVSVTALNRVAQSWGGQSVYFHMGRERKFQERNEQLFSEFTGRNHLELARKYQISEVHVYRLINRITEEKRKQRFR